MTVQELIDKLLSFNKPDAEVIVRYDYGTEESSDLDLYVDENGNVVIVPD